jgi:hypothetical protein
MASEVAFDGDIGRLQLVRMNISAFDRLKPTRAIASQESQTLPTSDVNAP